MARYKVTFDRLNVLAITVEADDPDEAFALADKAWRERPHDFERLEGELEHGDVLEVED
ncbi:MAG: hypothetical protein JO288_07735 [Hyphomicrobiales bacterium]|nr:hypothetical protein [Hyphomicrobiales bacterium]